MSRGRHAEQLERWLALYPREQPLALRFEDLAKDPLGVLNRTLAWLNLLPMKEARLEPHNSRNFPLMNPETAEKSHASFEPENRRLDALLGQPMGS